MLSCARALYGHRIHRRVRAALVSVCWEGKWVAYWRFFVTRPLPSFDTGSKAARAILGGC